MSQADYDEGKSHYASKNYYKAIESFQKCLQNNFNSQRALIYLCECNLELLNLDQLKECIDKIIQLDPKNTQVYYYLGKYEFNRKHYDKAYEHLMNYVEKNRLSDSQNIAAYESLCDCKMKQGIYNSALEHIDYAGYFDIKDKTKKLMHTIKKVQSMNHLEKYEDVIQRINSLSLKDEQREIQDQLMLQKAIALARFDKTDTFEECFNICLDYSQVNKDFLYPFAICYLQTDNLDSALETCQDFLKHKSDSDEGFLLLGQIYAKKGKTNEALRSFSKAISINSRLFNAYLEIANILVQQKKYNDAFNQIKSIEPRQEETLMALLFLLTKADVYYNLNCTKEANIIMDQVGELLRDNDIENKIANNILSEALEKYFELFHLKGGYYLSEFDKGTEELGKGGFGKVTKGVLKKRDVAVKQYLIDPVKRKEKGMTKFFIDCINEMKIHEELNHPNILKLITVFYVDDLIYIITELCAGGNLHALVHNTSLEFPFKNRIEILIQITDGLRYMHSFKKPYIHHDVKSLNVLLINPYNKNGTNSIKICDFGLTKNTWVYNTCGTPAYIPPELIMSKNHTEKVDVYSFGIMMWEMFTRTSPFKDLDPKDLAPRIINNMRPDQNLYESLTTQAVKALIEKCWAQEMTSRPTMNEVYEALKKMI